MKKESLFIFPLHLHKEKIKIDVYLYSMNRLFISLLFIGIVSLACRHTVSTPSVKSQTPSQAISTPSTEFTPHVVQIGSCNVIIRMWNLPLIISGWSGSK
jgi:hypothetical protein